MAFFVYVYGCRSVDQFEFSEKEHPRGIGSSVSQTLDTEHGIRQQWFVDAFLLLTRLLLFSQAMFIVSSGVRSSRVSAVYSLLTPREDERIVPGRKVRQGFFIWPSAWNWRPREIHFE